MAKIACCYNCVYAFLDKEHTLECYEAGLLNWPACANHPESLGRMQRTPPRGICRNYRPKPATPEGEVKQIPLGDGYYAYVDAADYEWLSQWNWHFDNGYAARRERNKTIYMHREILQAPEGMIVDHKNRNKLDDPRDNLRVGTRQENLRNAAKRKGTSSRFKGVSRRKDRDIWSAGIGVSDGHKALGCYDDEIEAARAYDRAAVEYFREFARLNFPEEWPPERRQEVYAQTDAAKAEGEKAGGSEGKRCRTKDRAARRDEMKSKGKKGERKEGKTKRAMPKTSARRKTSGAPPRALRAARRAAKKPTTQRTMQDAKRKTNSRRATGHRSRAARPKAKGSRRTGSGKQKARAGHRRHA